MGTIFGLISSYKIFGLIPLDLVLHCLIGGLITYFGIKQKFSLGKIFIALVIIAGLKELNDYLFHLPNNYTEYLFDFLITFVYITIVWAFRRTRDKVAKVIQEPKKWYIY